MAKRIYRTAKGKMIDMEALRIANEKTVAAGNMSVNAKGDIIQGGKVIKSAKERVAPSYQRTTQVERVSLKKPLQQQKEEIEVGMAEKPPLPPMDTSEMTTETIKTRDDGSRFVESISPSGDIKIKELDAPKKKTSKKKAKAKPKKPSV